MDTPPPLPPRPELALSTAIHGRLSSLPHSQPLVQSLVQSQNASQSQSPNQPQSSISISMSKLPPPRSHSHAQSQAQSLHRRKLSEPTPNSSSSSVAPLAHPSSITAATSSSSLPLLPVSQFLVYPALLSQIANSFRTSVPRKTHTKDSLEYKDSFLGRKAVDTIMTVIKSTDRNLALLLGRSLDSQSLFHSVTYTSRLRDSNNEIYQFTTTHSNEPQVVNGVFTLLTNCYSATCSRDHICYSIACPRRLEQMGRLNRPMVHEKVEKEKHQKLWSTSVPRNVVDSLSPDERKRQEIIFELISTEKEYLDDLNLVQRLYRNQISSSDIILDPLKRDNFLNQVFTTLPNLIPIHSRLVRKLLSRQKDSYVVASVGDVFLSCFNKIELNDHYVNYGGKMSLARHFVSAERDLNPELNSFLNETERHPDCRKLPLLSFLTRPTTRMGRYPMLLEGILKKSSADSPDRSTLPKVISLIRDILFKINVEAGKSENLLKLTQLHDSLMPLSGGANELNLLADGRKLVREGSLLLRKASGETDVNCYIFDHCFLVTKKKKDGLSKIHKRPIPLELLVIASDKLENRGFFKSSTIMSGRVIPSSTLNLVHNDAVSSVSDLQLEQIKPRPHGFSSAMGNKTSLMNFTTDSYASSKYGLNIVHLGRYGGLFSFIATSHSERLAWKEAIESQRAEFISGKQRFETQTLCEVIVDGKVTCSCAWGNRTILATDTGIYLAESPSQIQNSVVGAAVPLGDREGLVMIGRKVLDVAKVAQMDILEDANMLIILSDKTLLSYPLNILSTTTFTSEEVIKHSKKSKKLASHISFFKVGVCAGRRLLCAVRSAALSSTIRAFEPVPVQNKKKQGPLGILFRGSEGLKVYKEFYIPTESTSIHFLKTKLCVGCTKGFEIVDLESLSTQGLLDPLDENLDFVLKRESLRPINIFKIVDGDFLLCYNEFAFYVDRLGRRSRLDSIINWSGTPTSFAYIHPFVIAFEPTFIEIRHVHTGDIQQVIPRDNLRTLNTDINSLHCVMDNGDTQVLFCLVASPENSLSAGNLVPAGQEFFSPIKSEQRIGGTISSTQSSQSSLFLENRDIRSLKEVDGNHTNSCSTPTPNQNLISSLVSSPTFTAESKSTNASKSLEDLFTPRNSQHMEK